jgi:PHD/YefM family antitoxin component YafN of YafNO toxin-antitoxin module
MQNISLPNAWLNLPVFINKSKKEPITIFSKNSRAVIISEAEYNALKETAYLTSIPKMAESLKEIENSPESEWIDGSELGW